MSSFRVKTRLSSLFKFKLSAIHLFLPLLVLLIALLQTTSIWNFAGEKVGESSIFYHSIGFFGGDFNPHCFGYGSLGMYITFLGYLILYVPLFIFGKFDSIEGYAMQMFYNGYFVLTARYIFAILGVIAVFVYGKIARQFKIPDFLIVSFIILSVVSIDAIQFANRARTDMLVGFFSALSVYFAIGSKNKKFLYFLAISIAGAIGAKISALPLVALLFIYVSYRLYDRTIIWKDSITITLTLLIFLFLFQPYMNWFDRIGSVINLRIEDIDEISDHKRINWGRNYYYSYFERFSTILNSFIKYCSLPVILTLPLIVFTKRYYKVVIPSVLVLLLLTVPFLISKEIMGHWFAPAFNLVRFISLLSIAGFYFALRDYFKKNEFSAKYLKPAIITLFIILSTIFVLVPDLKHYFKRYNSGQTNKTIAKEWIENNLLNNSNILLEWSVEHVIPTLYDPSSIERSKTISLVFIYGRDKNAFLNKIFEEYLENYYCDNVGVDSVQQVIAIRSKNNNATLINKDFREYYYVTSPSAYRRILNRRTDDLNPKRKIELESYIAYHKFMISNPLVKKFDDGTGSTVEVYKIDEIFRLKDDDLGYLFKREWGEIQLNDNKPLNRDITIDMLIRMNSYPQSWTSIISKSKKAAFENELNLRLKNDKDGHWYYGYGEEAIITKFKPYRILPLGMWVRITAIRNMSSGEQVIYMNNEIAARRKIENMPPAAITNLPIKLFGNNKRSLDAKIQYLQIWDNALTPLEIDNVDILPEENGKIENLIGYWRFENVKGEIVMDLSGNNNHLILSKQ